MSILYIAEKKMAGETLAAFLAKKFNVKAEACRTHIFVGNHVVAWLSGHVLEQFSPEEYDPSFEDRRNFSILPIVPTEFKLKVISRTKDLVSNIKMLLKNVDSVCHFGDPDREGQLIVDELLDFLGNKKHVTRLWTSALNNAGLEKAFLQIKPNSDFSGYRNSALARSHADWLYGINMSRAVTISARTKGASGSFTVGRVQTPTLALVVKREDEIKGFVSVDHFKPFINLITNPSFKAVLSLKDDDERLNSEGLLTNKIIADEIVKASMLAGSANVVECQTSPHTESAPLPFSLSSLQGLCSSLFGFSGSKTLEIAQSLYLLKIISYPRASCDYLPVNQFIEAPQVIMSLSKASLSSGLINALRGAKLSFQSRAWNDNELEKHGHHAIAPVALDNPSIVDSLTEEQKKVYFEIVKRFLLQFWPLALYEETKIVLLAAGENYQATGKRYTDEGWRKAFTKELNEPSDQDQDENDSSTSKIANLPLLKVGQVIQIANSGYDSLVTKPPKRFTEGTLLIAMKNIHKFVANKSVRDRLKESAGIGTEATRAETIKGLIDKELIILKKKELIPSEKGAKLIHVLPNSMITPDMTAMWESFMDLLINNKSSYSEFLNEQKTWLKQLVASSTKFFDGVTFTPDPNEASSKLSEFSCFNCNQFLSLINYKEKSFFACDGCKNTYGNNNGNPVKKEDVIPSGITCITCNKNQLIRRLKNGGEEAFWTCAGWKPNKKGCNASYSDNNGEPVLVIKTNSENSITCPQCKKGHLIRYKKKPPSTDYFWGCSQWKSGCKFMTSDNNNAPELNNKKTTNVDPKKIEDKEEKKEKPLNKFMGFVQGRGSFLGVNNEK